MKVLATSLLLALALPARADDTEKGLASWYGKEFHGRPTASGERFDKEAMTAAHRTLPFGTLIEVRNLDNDAVAVVRVNDRGPFVHGRILDCSEGAAKALGFCQAGVAPVRITTVGLIPDDDDARLTKKERKRLRHALDEAGRTKREDVIPRDLLSPVDPNAGPFEVQVGAFKDPINADRLARRLREGDWMTRTTTTPDGFVRVRVGPFATRDQAEEATARLELEEEPFIVRADPEP